MSVTESARLRFWEKLDGRRSGWFENALSPPDRDREREVF
jgi:hypothetical protein